MVNNEMRAEAERLESIIAEAQKDLATLRRNCAHPGFQPMPNQRMGMSIASTMYYCPDCLYQEDRDY